jgi:hypothetical protein
MAPLSPKKEKKSDTVPHDTISRFAEVIYNRSKEWGKPYGMTPRGEEPLTSTASKKATEMAEILNSHSFGGHDPFVKKLFELAIGEEIPIKGKEIKEIKGEIAIVLFVLSFVTGVNLPIGEAVICTRKSAPFTLLSQDGQEHFLPVIKKDCFRLATKGEIEEFLRNFINKENRNKGLLEFLLFLVTDAMKEKKD